MPAIATSANKKQKWIPRKQFLEQKHPRVRYEDYHPYGASAQLFQREDPELVIAGPADTGKSRACLELVNYCCDQFAGIRALMIRKTRRSLTQSGMVTFEKEVLPRPDYAPFHTGDQEYQYANGSIFAVGGMDDPQKILSSFWDLIFAQQCEELELEEWELAASRIRHGKMRRQQILGDCNPGPPQHWIKARATLGKLTMLEARHVDNPAIWDQERQCWTEQGVVRIARLDALTGVRYQRLRLGLWAAAEGIVYEQSWDRALHVIDRFKISDDWPRYWSVDFGFTNPFVWAAWAQDPDGRLYRYREIYKTKTLVEDHARRILDITKGEPKPRAIICDHDAEDRATLERHLGMSTVAAWKTVSPGIQAVESRLRKAGDEKPRLFYLRDSLDRIDPELLESHLPTCSEDEVELYSWDRSGGRKLGEEPIKKYDHGMDQTRYLVAYADQIWKRPLATSMFPIISVTRSGEEAAYEDSSSGLRQQSGWRMPSSAPSRWGS